jgi:hypothetical protein
LSFALKPVGLVSNLTETINRLRLEILGSNPPPMLFHYTSFRSAVSIVNSRCLRASCVSTLRDDKDNSEIHHGLEILREEIQSLRNSIDLFSCMVLDRLVSAIELRVPKTFVLCFCGTRQSTYHGFSYGHFCLEFPTSQYREPLIRPAASDASVQYTHVIYGRVRQRSVLRRALKSCVEAIERNSGGTPEGEWMPSMSDFVARNAAELFLDLVVSFKRLRFALDREWRMVVRPNSALLSSAPIIADQNFEVLVKSESTRSFVELFLPVTQELFMPLLRPPIPFQRISSTVWARAREKATIIDALKKNGRTDFES